MTVLPFARTQHNGAPTTVEVDIVIPVYNEESRLEACITALRSFLDTSFPFDAAVVIADNASTDGTWRIASQLAATLDGVTAIHLDKKGRGRALRAEIGRKVEELAHEESRALRELAAEQADVTRLREGLQQADRNAGQAKAAADQASGAPAQLRAIFERAGAASALVEAKREDLKLHEQKSVHKEAQARDLRRQIDELRAQLARYAEALEEDLASGREKVAARTRDGLAFEKAFSEVSVLLLNHLKGKPEARDLLQELLAVMHGQAYVGAPAAKTDSRMP